MQDLENKSSSKYSSFAEVTRTLTLPVLSASPQKKEHTVKEKKFNSAKVLGDIVDISIPKTPIIKESDHYNLLLCMPKGYDNYVSKEFNELHTNLAKIGWSLLFIDEVNEQNIVSAILRSRFVLLWEAYELIERNIDIFLNESIFSSRGITRAFFCDDVHFFSKHRYDQRLNAFNWADLILATYPDKLQEWYPSVSKSKIVWIPHSAASFFEYDPNLFPSSTKVLLSGSLSWAYPFRQFCQAKLPKGVCEIVKHPGYPGYPGDKNNKSVADEKQMLESGQEKYALMLQKYPAMLVCGSIFNYLVAKTFEGMAAGCLIICDRSSIGIRLEALGFVEGEDYIGTDIFHVSEDVESVIRTFLKQNKEWRRVIENAAYKVHKEHTTKVRAIQIHYEVLSLKLSRLLKEIPVNEMVKRTLKDMYETNGVIFPLPTLGKFEVAEARQNYFSLCKPEDKGVLVGKSRIFGHLRYPWIMNIAKHPKLLDYVKTIIGPNVLLWVSEFNTKAPTTPHYISWHQDAYYWRFSSAIKKNKKISSAPIVTAWLALSPAKIENGCMRMVLGSHTSILEHRETKSEHNLLTRGQEIAAEVDEEKATPIELEEGQLSIHHPLMHHASGPNISPSYRIGLVFRFFAPNLIPPKRPALACLISGKDKYAYWDHVEPPEGDQEKAEELVDASINSVQSFTGAKFK